MRICPPYPHARRKRQLNCAVSRNNTVKRVFPCRCLDGRVKETHEMSMAWSPTVGSTSSSVCLHNYMYTCMCRHIYNWNVVECDVKVYMYSDIPLEMPSIFFSKTFILNLQGPHGGFDRRENFDHFAISLSWGYWLHGDFAGTSAIGWNWLSLCDRRTTHMWREAWVIIGLCMHAVSKLTRVFQKLSAFIEYLIPYIFPGHHCLIVWTPSKFSAIKFYLMYA